MDNRQATAAPDSAGCFRFLFVLGFLFCLAVGLVLVPAIGAASRHHYYSRTKCSNNLRQLGMAGIQYADDKRFFPHVGKLKALDGGYDTNHTPKVVRSLLWYGYHDNPEGWICPDSMDMFIPISNVDVRESTRLWFWDGEALPAGDARSPFADGQADPTLRETSELSYGWTRKGMNTNVRSTAVLAADRAVLYPEDAYTSDLLPGEVGNHGDGVNVLKADATVEYFSVGYEGLPEALATVSFYEPSISYPGRPTPDRRASVWLGLMPFVLVAVGFLGWFWYMGYRRRVPYIGAAGSIRKRARWLTADVLGTGSTGLGEPERNEEGKPKVTLSAGQRCPFCLQSATPDDDLVACVSCGTLLHRECVQEGGTCSTLGCKNQRRV